MIAGVLVSITRVCVAVAGEVLCMKVDARETGEMGLLAEGVSAVEGAVGGEMGVALAMVYIDREGGVGLRVVRLVVQRAGLQLRYL